MQVKPWITRFRKFARSKKSPLRSPQFRRVAFVSLVVIVAVAAIVLVAYQATPAVSAAPVAAVVAARKTPAAPAPAKKTGNVKARPADAAAAAPAQAPAPDSVTITGCLEQDHDAFRLKDTTGADAPKSRSWKTAFLTKHAAQVTVVDGTNTNRLQLGTHVGERVSVTGALADRELQARSLQLVAAACD